MGAECASITTTDVQMLLQKCLAKLQHLCGSGIESHGYFLLYLSSSVAHLNSTGDESKQGIRNSSLSNECTVFDKQIINNKLISSNKMFLALV